MERRLGRAGAELKGRGKIRAAKQGRTREVGGKRGGGDGRVSGEVMN